MANPGNPDELLEYMCLSRLVTVRPENCVIRAPPHLARLTFGIGVSRGAMLRLTQVCTQCINSGLPTALRMKWQFPRKFRHARVKRSLPSSPTPTLLQGAMLLANRMLIPLYVGWLPMNPLLSIYRINGLYIIG